MTNRGCLKRDSLRLSGIYEILKFFQKFTYCYFLVAVAVAVAVEVAAPGDFVAVPGEGVASPGDFVAVPGEVVVTPGVVGVVVGVEVTVEVPVPGSSFFAQAPRLNTKAITINRAKNLFIYLKYPPLIKNI